MFNRYVTENSTASMEFVEWMLAEIYDMFPDDGPIECDQAMAEMMKFIMGIGQ